MSRTSLREITHLVISLVVLTIAFTYPSMRPDILAIVAIGVGSGFLLHELAHKFTAQKYGYFAEYEASPIGLTLAIVLRVFTGIVFAAPGAVMIYGKKAPGIEDRYLDSNQASKEFAYISVSGVVVNLILAISFFLASLYVVPYSLTYRIFTTGYFINVVLAGFNMIPVGPLDGAKVWKHNPVLWGMVGIPSIILFLFMNW
ncbi:MAG: site-2 protease family protein [Candidatus Methanoperedens sp.]|nr:site-2 protease family protein [Candidatus Methanoperedens sp.]